MAVNRAQDLQNQDLENEIELLGRVLEVAAQVDRPRHDPELDRAFGVNASEDVIAER
jgi:hypothetical protein